MTQAVTFDDVWKMFQETDRKFQEMVREDRERRKELDRRVQETDRQIKEVSAQMRETDRKFQDTDRKIQDTDRKIQDTDRKIQDTDRKFQDTDRKIKEVSRQIGNLGSRWGEFVEGIVAPACETLFAAHNIPVREVYQRVKARLPGNRHMEIDLLAVNGDVIVPIEVKSRLRVEDVRDFIRRLGELKEFMPRYADARVSGAVAGIVVEEGVDRYAMNEGLFVIVQSGDSVKLANDGKFVPRTW